LRFFSPCHGPRRTVECRPFLPPALPTPSVPQPLMPTVILRPLHPFSIAVLLCAGVPRARAAEAVSISEFLADNVSGLQDEDANRGDWIELINRGGASVDLNGWWLSDSQPNKRKWAFPAVTIAPGATLLVWADGKDRRVPGQPLHTNFSLSKTGEYLGLHRPDAASGLPVTVDEFAPAYPPQVSDVSCGRLFTSTATTVLGSGATGKYRILPNDANGQAQYTGTNFAEGNVGTNAAGGWNVAAAFDDTAWTSAATGIGYDTGGTFLPLLGAAPSGNCQAALRNVNTSLLFRSVFNVPDAAAPLTWKLRMKFDDGYAAFINGHQVDVRNFTGTLTYNSKADGALNGSLSWTEVDFPAQYLVTGANVLAVQGLNREADNSDFLLLPEIQSLSAPAPGPIVYFLPPTPNAANGTSTEGPLLLEPAPSDPEVPRPLGTAASPPMVVSVRALVTRDSVSSVKLFHRAMWAAESAAVALSDNGVAPDAMAGDGIFTGSVPTAGAGPGQMLRWRFEAQDTAGHVTRLPAFLNVEDSPKYFGTVAVNPATATSQLPILEWFVEGAPSKGPTGGDFHAACYFLSRFYDNIEGDLHGESTGDFPKKSYHFDFNAGQRFIWKEGEIAAKDINLLTNYADKTKARNTLSHEVGRMTGTPYHHCFPVRVQLNAGFHAVLDLMEDSDDHMLERNGLDPLGALYKMRNELDSATSDVDKKTRRDENNSDLQALVDGLRPTLALAARRTWAYDNLNIPAAVNYLTTRQLNSDRDHGHKNFLLYRDTNGTREWQPIIWDVDLSQGHNFDGSREYFDDQLSYHNALNAHASNNRLYNLILESPEFQEMWVRRMRTLMDTIMQPPGTTGGILETRMREIAASIDPDPANSTGTDGDLDTVRWGFPFGFAPNRPREEVERVTAGYFALRRTFLFDQSASRPLLRHPSLNNGIPLPNAPQSAGPGSVVVDSVDFYPAANSQAGEYVILRNTAANAIDVSGWTLDGAVRHTMAPGTVIPSGAGTAAVDYKGLLHVVKDAVAFRARTSGPHGGEKRLIQGNFEGQLSSRGETLELKDAAGTVITTFSYAGSPTVLQQVLRISEIDYHPAGPTPAEQAALPGIAEDDFEFIEFVNTGAAAISLDGVTFTAGITYTFPSQTVLNGGARLVLAKNQAAFHARHPGVAALGPYTGRLENEGEQLELSEPSGEVILDFSYRDGWYPATDGGGYSLVARQPAETAYDAFGEAEAWAISETPGGTPGAGDTAFATAYHGWDNRYFSGAERDDPAISGPDADPDHDGRSNMEEYAFATDPRVPDLNGLTVDLSGGRAGLRFRRARAAVDLSWVLEACSNPATGPWTATAFETVSAVPAGEVETVVLREQNPPAGARRFYRVRCTLTP
jgi:hypothetical protein